MMDLKWEKNMLKKDHMWAFSAFRAYHDVDSDNFSKLFVSLDSVKDSKVITEFEAQVFLAVDICTIGMSEKEMIEFYRQMLKDSIVINHVSYEREWRKKDRIIKGNHSLYSFVAFRAQEALEKGIVKESFLKKREDTVFWFPYRAQIKGSKGGCYTLDHEGYLIPSLPLTHRLMGLEEEHHPKGYKTEYYGPITKEEENERQERKKDS